MSPQQQLQIDSPQTFQRDPYYFAIKLKQLKRNKKKIKLNKKAHFKFIIQQDNYIIDQTRHPIVPITLNHKIDIPFHDETLNFFIPNLQQDRNTQFQLKLYCINEQQVQELGTIHLYVQTYIQVFLEDNKYIFNQISSLCPEFSLEYQLYVAKSKIQLQNVIVWQKSEKNPIQKAFKKKNGQIIQVQEQNIQVKQRQTILQQSTSLRKSIKVQIQKLKKLKQAKSKNKRHQMQLEESRSHKSNFSILTKVSNLINSRFNRSPSTLQTLDDQKSQVIQPPKIGPHKFFQPNNKPFYRKLSIQRRKEKQRVQKYLHSKYDKASQTNWKDTYKAIRIVILLLILALVLFYLNSPSHKRAYYKRL